MLLGFATNDWSPIELADGVPEPGGSGWYRVAMPAMRLRAAGHDVTIGRLVAPDRPGSRLPHLAVRTWGAEPRAITGFDVLVMQRWMHAQTLRNLRAYRKDGGVVVNDVDDWFWGLDPSNLAYTSTDARVHPDCNRDIYLDILRASTLVTTSTPFLADRLRPMLNGTPVEVVRNAIDLARWTPRDASTAGTRRVGWYGHLGFRSRDLDHLVDALPRAVVPHGWTFFHAGHCDPYPPAGQVLGFGPDEHDFRGMWPISELPGVVREVGEVGIVPLSSQPFNDAKSAIKGMEMAAAGVPFVASSAPEYRWLRAEHGIGVVAKTVAQWVRHVEVLIRDQELRAELAEQNRMAVKALDIDNRWHEWEQVFEYAAGLR